MPKKLPSGRQETGVYEISDQGDLVLVSRSLRAHLMKSLYPNQADEVSDAASRVGEETSLDRADKMP
ncbi:hypothetical protein [Iodobacter fluviatilis]|uniref:Uncharacterized protein n=1 Tax=Iodobacter fluviatilis TaxID=537 RepID=A0A377Q5S9_9NEIS|nr:hypothetical protein [Iodobacter fluviatilis]TCU84605.1 hypothetical protein EV682_109130 [Iodobacter fluviatilis]STQ90070.1 Uncharacterised protein [Iodobacter fluviatilis]